MYQYRSRLKIAIDKTKNLGWGSLVVTQAGSSLLGINTLDIV